MVLRDLEYLTVADVIALYQVAMRESRQLPDALVREDALQSAVHHPRNLGYYEDASLAEQAVELMLHIAAAHAWVDGNKRVAAISLYAFLGSNGVTIPDEPAFRTAADLMVSWFAASLEQRPHVRETLIRLVESWIAE